MAARKKSKTTTKSKTKKTRTASKAKTASKRPSKEASSSSVRGRVAKAKPTSRLRAARKTIRAKMKNIVTKPSKRRRKSPSAGTATRARGAAKRLSKVASTRKPAAPKSVGRAAKSAAAAKGASASRRRAKEMEARLVLGSRGAPEVRTAPDKGAAAAVAGPKLGPARGVHIPVASTESTSTAKSAAPGVRVQKPGGPEEAAAKSLKAAGQRQGFKLNEFVVYPAHGVGQIVAIEEQEVVGFRLELFVISFSKDKKKNTKKNRKGIEYIA